MESSCLRGLRLTPALPVLRLVTVPSTHFVPLCVWPPSPGGNCQPLKSPSAVALGGAVSWGEGDQGADGAGGRAGATYCAWLLSRRGTDCKETGNGGRRGCEREVKTQRGRVGAKEPRERSWMPSPGFRQPEANGGSPAFCSADPISNIFQSL